MLDSTSPKSKVEWALWSAARGRRVFPVKPNGKTPLVKGWPEVATTDEAAIMEWWARWPEANIGVACGDGLLVLDLDTKSGKDGIANALKLFDLDVFNTFRVRTPSGGQHLLLRGPDVSNSVGEIGDGIDVRSNGGFVVGPGSEIGGKPYEVMCDAPLAVAPVEGLNAARHRDRRIESGQAREPSVELDRPDAIERGRRFLETEAPVAIEGGGGDATTFKVAARLKDFGISKTATFDLMAELWNAQCDPPWDLDELASKVRNAFRYGDNRPGSDSPAHQFGGVNIEPDPPKQGREWFLHGDDHTGAVEWLYTDLLPTTGVVILSGPSGAGKTFVALYLAKSLATGEPFFRVPPNATGGTMLLVGEAFGSVKRRMAALGEGRLPVAATYVGGLAARGAWTQLCADAREQALRLKVIRGEPVRMIVLDTLSSSGLLAEENDNGQAATALKALAELSSAMGVLVVVVHHPPKSGHGERGAGAIRNNADYVMTINREGAQSLREIEMTKSRDDEERPFGTFTLIPVAVEGGTTMVVSPGEPRIKHGRPSDKAHRFQRLFDEAFASDPQSAEGRRAVRTAILRKLIASGMKKPDGSNIRRAIREACNSGRFEEIETSGVAWVAERLLFDPPVVEGVTPRGW